MKKIQKAASHLRGLLAGFAVLAGVTAAHAHPYAGAITNIVLGGSNYVQFVLNEGATGTNGVNVTVVTYPSGTTNVLGNNVPSGTTNFPLGADTSFTITCTKIGNGSPLQTSPDTGWCVWNGGTVGRGVDVNKYAKYGDSFGRVYVADTGSATAASGGVPFRAWGIFGLTPDLGQNSFFGGNNPNAMAEVVQTNTLTFNLAPTNGQTFAMDGITATYTTNTVTNTATQIAVTNSAAASATNLAAYLNTNLAAHPGTPSVTVSGSVVTLLNVAQNISGEPYYSFANPGAAGPFGPDFLSGNNGFGSGPYRMFVGTDGLVWVTAATENNANIFMFGRNFEYTNKVFTVSGRTAGEAAGEHGNVNSVAVTGSLDAGNLQIFTADNDMSVPSYLNNTNLGVLGNGGIGNFGAAQETVAGDANEIYRYDIGAGPFPCTNTPVFAATLGLDGGFPNGQVIDVTVGPNTNYVYATMRRANYSDGNLQVFRRDTGARVYTSLGGSPTAPNDLFGSGDILPPPASGSVQGDYAGPRVSPDGRYIAVMTINDRIVIANLTNGIPDESSIMVIAESPSGATGREIAWDAADNLYSINNSGQNLLRAFSLGLTTTCVTSNDITGTNGTFQLILPPAGVSVANLGNASQNYGSPIAGTVAFNLTTSNLLTPVKVNFTLGGTATNGINYNITVGTLTNGVIVTTNGNSGTITFPATNFPGAGNWAANLTITPTASPLEGPTLTVAVTVAGGTTYFAAPPLASTVSIANTGPQFFFISAAPTGTTLTRSITNDYAKFIITRWGDLNGPSNSASSVSPKAITITNFTYKGTAVFPTDFTAGVQKFTGTTATDGNFGVTFNPGDVSLTVIIGNPVSHANVLAPSTNATIIPTLTNAVTGTNLTSSEGYTYIVNTSSTTITEFDNAVGTVGEVVLWSDALTNTAPTNFTVTFASTQLATTNVLPVVITNYAQTNGSDPNGTAAAFGSGSPSNSFDVQLGFPISSENAFETAQGTFAGAYPNPPASPVMAANGWSNVLRMTVNKQQGANPAMCGVNAFPTTNTFVGNYALRFDMYLSVWSGALNNGNPLNFPRQFAAFGINTQGTNTDWRLSLAGGIPAGSGSSPTNADGIWYCIDAGDQSLTPADFDGFASPAVPNAGTADFVSGTALTEAGVFKRPPFPATDGAGAGTPINQWVNVSVETTSQTNVALLIDGSTILANLAFTNVATGFPNNLGNARGAGLWTNGTPMLGYLQPYSAQSDESAFVYFSNVRIVELSPYIILQPLGAFITPGQTLTFNSAATYAQPGLTNVWWNGKATVTTPLQTNSTVGTNLADSITISNILTGTNYYSVYTDLAGSVTSFVACVEVMGTNAPNSTANQGAKATITVPLTGQIVPTFQWRSNGVNLANGLKYTNVTTQTLTISNAQPADTIPTYTCVVTANITNLNGNGTDLYLSNNPVVLTSTPATLTLVFSPSNLVVTPAAQTNLWGSSASFNVTYTGGGAPTYNWKKGGTNLVAAGKYAGTNTATLTISNLTQADAGSYTVGVTNGAGGTVSGPGVLSVIVPPPTFATTPGLTNGTLSFGFSSTNGFDTTNAFILQSAPAVTGPYTNDGTGTITGSAGTFNLTVPQPTNSIYYRLKHAN